MKSLNDSSTGWQAALARVAAGCRGPRCFAFLAGISFMMAVTPVVGWYWERVRDRSDEPLGVIALVAAVVLLTLEMRKMNRAQITLRPAWMLFGAVLLALVQWTSLAHFPLFSGLLAVVILGLSVEMPRAKAGILALLALSLPLVASLDFYAGYPLRLAAAQITAAILNVGGLGVEREGVMLMDGGSIVGLDPPCAGVRMLWTACFTAAVVAVWRRFEGWRTVLLMAGAVACVVLGNSVRAAFVFFPESGRVHWPEWMHPGVGLAVHVGVLAAVCGLGDWLGGGRMRRTKGRDGKEAGGADESGSFVALRSRSPKVMWALGVVVLGGALGVVWKMVQAGEGGRGLVSWPATLDGMPLVAMPLSAREMKFARAFPGQIAKFRCGGAEVILRRVNAATRYMHPSGDCLRAAGFAVTSKPAHRDADGRLWGNSIAQRGTDEWRVRERYVNAAQTSACTDASAWFWEAVLHPGDGPWMAVTVMEKVPHDTGSRQFSLQHRDTEAQRDSVGE